MTNDLLARIDAALIALPADVYDLLRECRERIDHLSAQLNQRDFALRVSLASADTLSPQEFINIRMAALGEPIHEYAGQCDPNRSLVEMRRYLQEANVQVQEGAAREAALDTICRQNHTHFPWGIATMNGPYIMDQAKLSEAARELLEWAQKGRDYAANEGVEMEAWYAERDRLQRENAALREALKLIRDCTGDGNAERVAENALTQLDASVQIPPPDPTIMDYVPGTEPRDAKEGK